MDEQSQLLLVVLGISVILGIVGTIAYYFSRYLIGEPQGPQTAKEAEAEEAGRKQDPPAIDRTPESESTEAGGLSSEVVAATGEGVNNGQEFGYETQSGAALTKQSGSSLTLALAPTRLNLWGRIKSLVRLGGGLKPELLSDLEEVLFTSDLGVATVQRLLGSIERQLQGAGLATEEKVREVLKAEMLSILGNGSHAQSIVQELSMDVAPPQVWMIVGVNGAGKTTTIGKLARELANEGKRVLIAAGDTFRAAAGEQLRVWSERAQVEIFAPEGIREPAAVAFQACERARAGGFDVVLLDTAGRLHTQKNLMDELKKVKRVMTKVIPQAPHLTLLVLDANSGQNALVQAREFHSALEIQGVVLTKMDGTAKGGVALSLATELKLPVRLIGIGEKIGDLKVFSPKEYVDSIVMD